MQQPPQLQLGGLEAILARRPDELASQVRHTAHDLRPCAEARATRVGDGPLRVGALSALFGRKPAAPALPAAASKFGGIPYAERDGELEGVRFLGQVNFAEVAAALSHAQAPLPAGMPEQGLLAIDLVEPLRARVRWYPDPDEHKARAPHNVPAVGRFEAALQFNGGWSLRGLDWFSAIPERDDELWDWMNDFLAPGVDEHAHERCHKLFGHTDEILGEFFDPALARPNSTVRDYVQVLRITYDRAADFAWGTNWLYVLVHRDDLARGAFGNAVVMVANA